MIDRDQVTEITSADALDTGATGRALGKRGSASVSVGDLLDERFQLERELGRGGMSIVFRARDLIKEDARDPDPFVAIKVLTGGFSERPEAWIALQREIKKAQTLAHPHIVTVHDFKVDRKLGVPFAQMEELRGEPLQNVISSHPNGIGNKAKLESIIIGIAEGLAYAHKSGIVHADLKPSNVVLTPDSGVKLLDFGISRFTSQPDGDFFDVSDLGALTPAYASPQRFDKAAPTPADDIFALGIISYQLAEGRHPFDALLVTGRQWVAMPKVIERLRRPRSLSPSQWKTIKACFAADPSERPADGTEFLERFQPRSVLPRNLAALAAVLAMLAVLGWLLPRTPQPELTVEQLPPERREQLLIALSDGETALAMQDYNGALVHFARAWDLHPRNPAAMEGLRTVVNAVLGEGEPESAEDIERRLKQLDILLEYPALSESARLIDYRAQLLDEVLR